MIVPRGNRPHNKPAAARNADHRIGQLAEDRSQWSVVRFQHLFFMELVIEPGLPRRS
jgi:hypothetical protein